MYSEIGLTGSVGKRCCSLRLQWSNSSLMLFLNSAQASGIDPKEKSNTKWALNPDVNSFIYQHAAFSVPIHLWSQRRYNHKEALQRVQHPHSSLSSTAGLRKRFLFKRENWGHLQMKSTNLFLIRKWAKFFLSLKHFKAYCGLVLSTTLWQGHLEPDENYFLWVLCL